MSHEMEQHWDANEQFIRDIRPLIMDLEERYRAALLLIDQGAGNTAGAFRDQEGTIWTAQHEVESGVATVIFPDTSDQFSYNFHWRGDDTAASQQTIYGWENGIPKGYPQEGDVNVALIARPSKSGLQFRSFWGEFVGDVRTTFHTWRGFRRRGGVYPRPGCSGYPILAVGRDGVALPEPYAVGLLRGMHGNICLFS